MTEGWNRIEDQDIIGQERAEEVVNLEGYKGWGRKSL